MAELLLDLWVGLKTLMVLVGGVAIISGYIFMLVWLVEHGHRGLLAVGLLPILVPILIFLGRTARSL